MPIRTHLPSFMTNCFDEHRELRGSRPVAVLQLGTDVFYVAPTAAPSYNQRDPRYPPKSFPTDRTASEFLQPKRFHKKRQFSHAA